MKSRFTRGCDHEEVVITVVAGIERTVCVDCGYVTIGFDHSTCTIWPDDRAPADDSSGVDRIVVPAI